MTSSDIVGQSLLVLIYIGSVTSLAYMIACYQSWRKSRCYHRKRVPFAGNVTPITQQRQRRVNENAEILQRKRRVSTYV